MDFLKLSFKQEWSRTLELCIQLKFWKYAFRRYAYFISYFLTEINSADVWALKLLTSEKRVSAKFSYHI